MFHALIFIADAIINSVCPVCYCLSLRVKRAQVQREAYPSSQNITHTH